VAQVDLHERNRMLLGLRYGDPRDVFGLSNAKRVRLPARD
jgi:hypothetical protein